MNGPSTGRLRLPGVGLVVMLTLAVAACTPTAAPTSGESPTATAAPEAGAVGAGAATQTNEGGGVTVQATWQAPGGPPTFTVVLDTHSVDLDGYDLSQLAALRVDGGPEVAPTGWDAPKGGHHRSGTLTFPATTAEGTPLIGPETRTVELVIREVGGVPERSLQWRP